MSEVMSGRRDRKKAATREALADAALRLFLERGFDQVSVREIADAADVSVSTLFKHFGSKEALVFDEEQGREAALLQAVRERGERSIPQALREHFARQLDRRPEPGGEDAGGEHLAAFLTLIRSTPALEVYGRQMWTRHETALAHTIAAESGAAPDDLTCAALARFALESPSLARTQPDVGAALTRLFELIEHGWSDDYRRG